MSNKEKTYSILVNSCDSYEDLWEPFFRLLSINWEQAKTKNIYLNTEKKSFDYPNLNIKTINYSKTFKFNSWSDRLYKSLKSIRSEYIVFLLDDFFMAEKVDDLFLNECVEYMNNNKDISCINFQKPYYGNNHPSKYNQLDRRNNGDQYTLTCQPALWRRKKLLKYLNRYENAWQFEQFGSARTVLYKKDEFYIVSKDAPNVFGYNFNISDGYGVCQGKWHNNTVELFKRYNIYVDFSKRGFFTFDKSQREITRGKCSFDDLRVKLHYRLKLLTSRK